MSGAAMKHKSPDDANAKRRAAAREAKDARLKAALRENLRRRKRQQSAQKEIALPPDADDQT